MSSTTNVFNSFFLDHLWTSRPGHQGQTIDNYFGAALQLRGPRNLRLPYTSWPFMVKIVSIDLDPMVWTRWSGSRGMGPNQCGAFIPTMAEALGWRLDNKESEDSD
jgi:hypothetical protein